MHQYRLRPPLFIVFMISVVTSFRSKVDVIALFRSDSTVLGILVEPMATG